MIQTSIKSTLLQAAGSAAVEIRGVVDPWEMDKGRGGGVWGRWGGLGMTSGVGVRGDGRGVVGGGVRGLPGLDG